MPPPDRAQVYLHGPIRPVAGSADIGERHLRPGYGGPRAPKARVAPNRGSEMEVYRLAVRRVHAEGREPNAVFVHAFKFKPLVARGARAQRVHVAVAQKMAAAPQGRYALLRVRDGRQLRERERRYLRDVEHGRLNAGRVTVLQVHLMPPLGGYAVRLHISTERYGGLFSCGSFLPGSRTYVSSHLTLPYSLVMPQASAPPLLSRCFDCRLICGKAFADNVTEAAPPVLPTA